MVAGLCLENFNETLLCLADDEVIIRVLYLLIYYIASSFLHRTPVLLPKFRSESHIMKILWVLCRTLVVWMFSTMSKFLLRCIFCFSFHDWNNEKHQNMINISLTRHVDET